MTDKIDDKELGYQSSRVQEALDTCTDCETLRCLYAEYSERLRNRGAHVWTTGAVFIPLSISGVIVAEKHTAWPLAIGSSLLIWTWFFVSERMRVELDRRRYVCAALETAMLKCGHPLTKHGLTNLVVLPEMGKLERFVDDKLTLRQIRLIVALSITIGWLVLTVYWTVI